MEYNRGENTPLLSSTRSYSRENGSWTKGGGARQAQNLSTEKIAERWWDWSGTACIAQGDDKGNRHGERSSAFHPGPGTVPPVSEQPPPREPPGGYRIPPGPYTMARHRE